MKNTSSRKKGGMIFQKKTHGFTSVPVLKEAGSIVMKYHQSPDGFPKLNQGYVIKVIKNLYRRGYSPNYLMTMSGHKSISSGGRFVGHIRLIF